MHRNFMLFIVYYDVLEFFSLEAGFSTNKIIKLDNPLLSYYA